MFGQAKHLILGVVAAIMISVAHSVPGYASIIGYDISWSGTNGYAMTGMFTFDSSDSADGLIVGSEVESLMLFGFLNGGSIGTFDLDDGINSGVFNFNFDAVNEVFLVGGGSGTSTGQCWNCAVASDVGLGFISGSTTQLLTLTGVELNVSGLPVGQSTLTATAKPVSEPTTLAVFGLGLAGLGYMRRKRAA